MKAWSLPIDEVGLGCFHAFDASLSKFDVDGDATMVTSIDQTETDFNVRKLETATLTALGTIPLRQRKLGSMWTLHFSEGKLFHNLPSWAHINIESKDGDFFEITNHGDGKWKILETKDSDIWLHLSLFGKMTKFGTATATQPRFLRLSSALEAQKYLDCESSSLSLYFERRVA